ncbi:MAG: DUF1501 domain-containing protein [Planctomycetaceae bacterium]|nr:DUF1501 domain-containing protein [Planctomycetales bacterium]MCB9924995.1 DUF1501 domain-containing protein [Planctomycetaceae bacterium]
MLEVKGRQFSCCDGITRRSALRVGVLGLGGLTLPQLLAQRSAQAAAGRPTRNTSVIFVELAGGPSHFETYDPKPNSPSEYRGPLQPIATGLAGVRFSEFMAAQARIADKLAIIRSIHHDSSSHSTSAHLTQTGYYLRDRQNRENEMPCVGSVASRLLGSHAEGIPAYVAIQRSMRYGRAAYFGKAFNPFDVTDDPNRSSFQVNNLGLVRGLDADRVTDRRYLLDQFDEAKTVVDTSGVSEAVDRFTIEAFDMVTSGKAQRAFDINEEPTAIRDRYGRNRTGQEFLLARRLIEAGVTFVSTRVSSWDDHNGIAKRMRDKGPSYDQALAALVSDLHERGLDQDVLIVAMGEFGRTPKVNRNAGRDHWGAVMSVLLAGGGLRVGQIVGSSTPKGETPEDNPYRPENVLAMVYRHLGIVPEQTFPDLSGRPRYLLEERGLISELI